MASVPCHYLRLRPLLPSRFFPEVPDDGSMEDAACFIKVMLLAGAIVSCHYLLSCLLLLFGGIMRGCHTLFVPWLVAHALILVMLSMSAAAEVNEEEKNVPCGRIFIFFMCVSGRRGCWIFLRVPRRVVPCRRHPFGHRGVGGRSRHLARGQEDGRRGREAKLLQEAMKVSIADEEAKKYCTGNLRARVKILPSKKKSHSI